MQGIKHQNFRPFKDCEGLFRNVVGVGDVAKITYSKPKNRKLVMKNWNRGDPDAVDLKGLMINFHASDLWYAWVFFIVENISILPLKLFQYFLSGKYGNVGLLVEVKGTDVIQACGMVFVFVCK